MSKVEKVSVALTTEMVAKVQQAVATGEYASTREVMRDWMLRRSNRAKAVEKLGRLWDDGLASGPSVDGEAAFGRVLDRLENHMAARRA